MFDWLPHFDVAYWVGIIGYFGVLLIVLLETGAFFGCFLPGDSLLFTAGMLAAKGLFDIWVLTISLIIVAFLGYMIGYWFGDKLGHWLMQRQEGFWFKKRYVNQAHIFYRKHGGKALLLGRLVPIVRTFVPIVAGMGEMKWVRYVIYNFLGALIWGGGLTLLGYYIGGKIPNAVNYIVPAGLLVILISVLPGIVHLIRKKMGK